MMGVLVFTLLFHFFCVLCVLLRLMSWGGDFPPAEDAGAQEL